GGLGPASGPAVHEEAPTRNGLLALPVSNEVISRGDDRVYGCNRSRIRRVRCSRMPLLPLPTVVAPSCTRVAVIVTRPFGRPLSMKLPFLAVWNVHIGPAFGPLCAISSTSTSTSSSGFPLSSMSLTSSPCSSSTSTTIIPQPFSSPWALSSPWLSSSSATTAVPQSSPSSCARARGVSQAAITSTIAAQNGKYTFRFIWGLPSKWILNTAWPHPAIPPLGWGISQNLP